MLDCGHDDCLHALYFFWNDMRQLAKGKLATAQPSFPEQFQVLRDSFALVGLALLNTAIDQLYERC